MDKRTERTLLKVALGFLVVLILGIGNLLVMAAINDKDNAVSDEEDETGNEEDDVAITGNELQLASVAALKYIGEGRVTDTEIGDEDGNYEVEVTLNNGKQVDVHLDENFNVLGHESDGNEDDE